MRLIALLKRWESYAFCQECQVDKFKKCWLFCDRLTKADDNAEHLYRYVKQNSSISKIYFLLSSSSPDWGRLSREGFNLIEVGSEAHRQAIRECSCLISSQADDCIVNYFGEHSDWLKNFVFLQHGVN